MLRFPRLRTGAVMQYPAQRDIVFSTHVVSFLDGSEQRFRDLPTALRRWVVRLNLLDEVELTAVDSFVTQVSGRLTPFVFVDPWDGREYSNCTLDADELTLAHANAGSGRTTITVRQNWT